MLSSKHMFIPYSYIYIYASACIVLYTHLKIAQTYLLHEYPPNLLNEKARSYNWIKPLFL